MIVEALVLVYTIAEASSPAYKILKAFLVCKKVVFYMVCLQALQAYSSFVMVVFLLCLKEHVRSYLKGKIH